MLQGYESGFDYVVRPHRLSSEQDCWLWEVRRNNKLVAAGVSLRSAEEARIFALNSISYHNADRRRSA